MHGREVRRNRATPARRPTRRRATPRLPLRPPTVPARCRGRRPRAARPAPHQIRIRRPARSRAWRARCRTRRRAPRARADPLQRPHDLELPVARPGVVRQPEVRPRASDVHRLEQEVAPDGPRRPARPASARRQGARERRASVRASSVPSMSSPTSGGSGGRAARCQPIPRTASRPRARAPSPHRPPHVGSRPRGRQPAGSPRMPSEVAMLLAVPVGRMVIGTGVPASAFMTRPTVPSPPATTTRSPGSCSALRESRFLDRAPRPVSRRPRWPAGAHRPGSAVPGTGLSDPQCDVHVPAREEVR